MTSQQFPNGLKRFNPGLAPGDPTGDRAREILDKLNYNFARVLIQEGSFIGPGLRWDAGLLKLANGDNQILIGNNQFTIRPSEFQAIGTEFALKDVPASKITGQLAPANIQLSNNNVLVGGINNAAGSIALDADHFTTAGSKLSIRAIPASALNSIKISPTLLDLANRQIAVGEADGTPAPYTLGTEFKLVGNEVKVELDLSLRPSAINAVPTIGTNPSFLIKSTDLTNAEQFNWASANGYVQGLIDRALLNENARNTVYVNPVIGNDAITNKGTSIYSPFKTIERAALEVVRLSYVNGLNGGGSDLYDFASIYLEPGTYYVDNRPGIANPASLVGVDLNALVTAQALWQFNPVSGGVVLPRGCSLIGRDLRKTNIIPLYIPTPAQARSCVFKMTGGNYISLMTFKDNPSILRSHHTLDCFRFASTADLNTYYLKIFNAFRVLDNYSNVGGPNLEPVLEETELVTPALSPTALDPNGFAAADVVRSASPYIFNVSVRSRFGLCSVLLDGSEVTGLKSLVAAQLTTVVIQVDPNAFEPAVGEVGGTRYKAAYESYAFKAINDAYAQIVSCFVIGSDRHFVTDSGGELSITNSCSNFGGTSLYSRGYAQDALNQDRNFNIVRILPPEALSNTVQEYIVGTLDTANVTPTVVGATIFDVAPIEFINNSYLYVRVPNPAMVGQYLDLQAKLVATGATTGTNLFNVVNGGTTDTEHSLYKYLQCVAPYRYESTWYDPLFPPVGGLPAAEATERALRAQLLQNASIFVKRIVESRTEEQRNYHLMIQAPPGARQPVLNYVLKKAQFQPNNHYFVGAVKEISAADLNSVGQPCCTISGTVYQITVLRGNRPEDGAATLETPDLYEDLDITAAYQRTLANLDPRLHTPASLLAVSVNQNNITYKAIRRLLLNLGYSVAQANTLLTATPKGTLVHRCTLLTDLPGVVTNSATSLDFVRPSLIRCAGHTWEWVGYKNYTTALPKFQTVILTEAKKLAALQTALNAGRIYATGMDELGLLYQGRNRIDLATGAETKIRFDGIQQTTNTIQDAIRSFTNLSITDRLQANNATINNLKVGNTLFQPSSAFKFDGGSIVADLTDANIPTGIKANIPTGLQVPRYGLVRKATDAEVIAKTGPGYLAPGDIASVQTSIDALEAQDTVVVGTGTNAHTLVFTDAQSASQLKILVGTETLPNTLNFGAPGPLTGTITFPTTSGYPVFTQQPKVFITPISAIPGGTGSWVVVGNNPEPSTTVFTWHADNLDPTGGVVKFDWIAIGY